MKRYRLMFLLLVCVCFLSANSFAADAPQTIKPTKSTTDQWHGYAREHFVVDGRKCYIVSPKISAYPKDRITRTPWVWRARFPNYHWKIDVKLLEKGIAIAYVDVAGMYGSPTAIEHGNLFYKEMQKRGYTKKVALEGVSRGGLFVYNWATANPDKVSCIYTDTPVCDFKSWPAGKGKGIGHKKSWQQCLQAYHLTEVEALTYKKNPIDNITKLAKNNIPMLTIISMNDVVVPPAENTLVMQQRVPKKNFQIMTVTEGTKKSQGHHFTHPKVDEVVQFIVKHVLVTQ